MYTSQRITLHPDDRYGFPVIVGNPVNHETYDLAIGYTIQCIEHETKGELSTEDKTLIRETSQYVIQIENARVLHKVSRLL